MTSRSKESLAYAQLRELLEYGRVQLEKPGLPTEYEVTVFAEMGSGHAHYGGDRLSEAISRAHAALNEGNTQTEHEPK